jgi:hypothetical protein
MHLNDRERLCPLELGQHSFQQQIKIFAKAGGADLCDERCDEAADKGGRKLRAGRVEKVAGDSHHLLEAGGAGGRVHGRRYLVRRDGQVGAQRFAAALQHGVVVRVQDGLHRWFSVTNLTS